MNDHERQAYPTKDHPDERRPWRLVPPDAVGCGFILVWPIVSAAVTIALWLSSPDGSLAWLLAALVLAFLGVAQGYLSEQTADIAGRFYYEHFHPPVTRRRRIVRVLLSSEELIRSILVPPIIGAIVAVFVAETSPLPALVAGLGVGAALVLTSAIDRSKPG